jgi:hypothetical protein
MQHNISKIFFIFLIFCPFVPLSFCLIGSLISGLIGLIRGTLFPKYDEISSSSLICHRHHHRLSAVSLRLTAGSDQQPGGWSAPATLDGPVGVASTTTTTKLKLFQT